jgi:hypothetical protein
MSEGRLKLYHRTYNTKEILAEGFKDGKGYYLTARKHRGVWLSNCPLDANEGAFGDTVLAIKIPIKEIRDYEWIEKGKGYREWLVPARVVNKFGPPTVEDVDQEPEW